MKTENITDNPFRLNAAIAGVLFIIGTASGVLSAAIGKPLVDAPDYLGKLASNEGTILLASLLQFIMGVSCAGIGLALYPILKKYAEGRAIASVGFRIIEGVLEILGAVALIVLLALSREFLKEGGPDASFFQTAGSVIKGGTAWINNVATLLSWCIGALLYYSVFYRYRLVPRWISLWGLLGISLTIVSCFTVMFGVIPAFGTVQVVSNLPIALQEMFFAVWLIAKGVKK